MNTHRHRIHPLLASCLALVACLPLTSCEALATLVEVYQAEQTQNEFLQEGGVATELRARLIDLDRLAVPITKSHYPWRVEELRKRVYPMLETVSAARVGMGSYHKLVRELHDGWNANHASPAGHDLLSVPLKARAEEVDPKLDTALAACAEANAHIQELLEFVVQHDHDLGESRNPIHAPYRVHVQTFRTSLERTRELVQSVTNSLTISSQATRSAFATVREVDLRDWFQEDLESAYASVEAARKELQNL